MVDWYVAKSIAGTVWSMEYGEVGVVVAVAKVDAEAEAEANIKLNLVAVVILVHCQKTSNAEIVNEKVG